MKELYHGRYEPVRLVATGGQGELWRALDRVHDRHVALKIRDVSGSGREAVLREARTMLDVRPHPGLPVMRGDFFDDDRYIIVMDWIDGASLDGETVPFEEVLAHLDDVAHALDHLHSHSPPIAHRDVKPANIIVTADGRAVLVDLGLAGPAPVAGGTPFFQAPDPEVTPASDIFSLAATAHALLLGSAPEPGREPDWRRVPSALREQVGSALDAGLSTDPALRPHSATAFVASLRPRATPNNLPAPLTTLVGRKRALADLRRLLPETRFLTLAGPGGSGKTRLAVELAGTVLPAFSSGVWFVELGALSDPNLIPDRVADVLGLRSESRVLDELVATLGAGRQLLVLDNCEHMTAACAELAEQLLRLCAELTVVATSREPLRGYGERVWLVPPLTTSEAERLFRERSATAIGEDELIASICTRLDGMPLAIELAGARSLVSGPREVAEGLDEALRMLTGGARTVPRQETLRATIDWSHELLPAEARVAFRRLSVFAGSFGGRAAADVCEAGDALQVLVSASLLSSAGNRFRMLETVRQYASEKLRETGEETTVKARLVAWYAALADPPYETLTGPGWPDWLDDLSDEHENLRAVLEYAFADDPAAAARVAACLGRYWVTRGHWNEGRMWLERALTITDTLDPATRARLLRAAANITHAQGDLDLAQRRLDEALDLNRELGDLVSVSSCLHSLAIVALEAKDLAAARAFTEESLAIKRRLGDALGVANSLGALAAILVDAGDDEGAHSALQESLAIRHEIGDTAGEAMTLTVLAEVVRRLGDRAASRRHAERALEIAVQAGDEHARARALDRLARAMFDDGDTDEAAELYDAALAVHRMHENRRGLARALLGRAGVALATGDLDTAERLSAEALDAYRSLGEQAMVFESLAALARVARSRADPERVAELLAQADAVRRAE